MKSKTPLVIMEQTIMILVFALAAAVCMQIFVHSNRLSRYNQQRDDAVVIAQNTAETLKRLGGKLQTPLCYDQNGQPVTDQKDAAYWLNVIYTESGDPNLWTATVEVTGSGNIMLFELPVAGQRWEVPADG